MSIDNYMPRREPLGGHDPSIPAGHSTQDGRSEVENLYRERVDRLIGHFSSGSTDRDSARDIVHEAFAKLAALGFAGRTLLTRPDAYLYRICVNLLRDRSRAQLTRRSHEQRHAEAPECHDPVAQLEHRDTLRRLEAAMLRLKPETREIFLAKRLDGMTYSEIAERTGLSVKGVEKHMSKAIAAIDRFMERDRP